MSFTYYLPGELWFIFQQIDDQDLQGLEINLFEIHTLDIKILSKTIINHILKKFPKLRTSKRPETLYAAYLSLAILAENYKQIEEVTSQPNSTIELLCQFIAQFALKRDFNQWTQTLDNLSQTVKDYKMNDKIINITRGWTSAKGDALIWLEDLTYVTAHFPSFINRHLVIWIAFLRTMGNLFYLYPVKSRDIMAPFLKYIDTNPQLKYLRMVTYMIMGGIETTSMKLSASIDYYNQAIEIAKELDYSAIHSLQNNSAIVYSKLGEHEKARDIYVSLSEQFPNDIIYKNNLRDAYRNLENCSKAIELAEEVLNMFEKQKMYHIGFHYAAIDSYVFCGQFDKVHEIKRQAEEIKMKYDNRYNNETLHRIEATIHHYEGNFGLAQSHYQQALNVAKERLLLDMIFYYYTKQIEVQIDLYTLKLGDLERKRKLYRMVNTLLNLTDEQGMTYATIETLQLRSKIYLNEGDLHKAKKDIYNATKLAEEFEFDNVYEKLSKELEEINYEINEELQRDSPATFAMKLKNIVKNLLGITEAQTYRSNPVEIHGLIILSKEGIMIFSKYFTTRLQSDPSLISGLVSAVSSLMAEIVSGIGFLKSIHHEDLTLVLEPLDEFVIVGITSAESFDLVQTLEEFAHKIYNIVRDRKSNLVSGQIPPDLNPLILQVIEQMHIE